MQESLKQKVDYPVFKNNLNKKNSIMCYLKIKLKQKHNDKYTNLKIKLERSRLNLEMLKNNGQPKNKN